MRERLLATIRQKGLMRAGERVGVAVSGGADSVALLRLLLEAREELGVVLSVAHFNHKLRAKESEADEEFVRELAKEHGLEFFCEAGDTRAYAAGHRCGIEAAARELRYEFFWRLLSPQGTRGNAEENNSPLRTQRDAKENHSPQGTRENAEENDSPLRAQRDANEKLSPQGTRGNLGENNSPQRTQRDAKVLDRIATAHTLEDQAETVVMRLTRGAGTRGMAGIYPIVRAEKHVRLSTDDCRLQKLGAEGDLIVTGETPVLRAGAIVRPLLEFRRAQLRHYLKRAGQSWREDASNQDVAFARNRVRQEVMPKLRELNPAIEMVLGETAEIARAEEEYWRDAVDRALLEVSAEKQGRLSIGDCRVENVSAENAEWQSSQRDTQGPSTTSAKGGPPPLGMTKRPTPIDIPKIIELPLALRRRVVREFAERQGVKLEFHHVEQVLEIAAGAPSRSVRRVELVEGWDAVVIEDRLRLERRSEKKNREEYDLELPIPGEVVVEAAGITVRAQVTDSGPRLKMGVLRVRNWRPGDRYRPAHTGSEKKVKELLQDRRIPAEARASWPVVVVGDEIVWVPEFAYPEHRLVESGQGVALDVEKLNHF